jgi:hypothetical protein
MPDLPKAYKSFADAENTASGPQAGLYFGNQSRPACVLVKGLYSQPTQPP